MITFPRQRGPWCPLNDDTASDVLYEQMRDDMFGFDDEEIIEGEER